MWIAVVYRWCHTGQASDKIVYSVIKHFVDAINIKSLIWRLSFRRFSELHCAALPRIDS